MLRNTEKGMNKMKLRVFFLLFVFAVSLFIFTPVYAVQTEANSTAQTDGGGSSQWWNNPTYYWDLNANIWVARAVVYGVYTWLGLPYPQPTPSTLGTPVPSSPRPH